MTAHRAHVRGFDGITHDVRVWRTATAACRAVMFNPWGNDAFARFGFRLILEGQKVEDPVDCMSCLVAQRTPYAVLCDDHGQQFLTEKEYVHQMRRSNALWRCPICGESAYWDDDEYDATFDEKGPDVDETDRQAT